MAVAETPPENATFDPALRGVSLEEKTTKIADLQGF
jgi:hypothetical protein